MCELTITELRSDLATMAKHGRLIGYDVSAPTTTHPAKDKDVRPEPLCDSCGEWTDPATLVDGDCRGCRVLREAT